MKGKKLLAGVLSAAMVLGTMAFPAFAEENPGTNPVEEFMSLKAQSVNDTHEIDLNGEIVNVDGEYWSNIYADITIKNGTINFSDFTTPDGIFRIGYWSCDHPVTLTLENMTINVTNVTTSTGVFTMQNQDDTLVLNNSTINATEITNTPGIFYTPNGVDSVRGSVKITGGRMNVETGSALFFNNDVDLNSTAITCKVDRPVFRQSAGSVEDTTIIVNDVIDGATRGIVEDVAGNPDGTVKFKKSHVNAPEGQVLVKTNTLGKILAVADNASTYTVGETVKPMASEETGVQLFTASIGDNYYISLEDAVAAAQDGDTITILGKIAVKPGDLPSSKSSIGAKTLTFKGADENSKMTFVDGVNGDGSDNAYYAHGSNLTFDGLKITWIDVTNYQGIMHPASVEYKNCTISGMLTLYGNKNTFTDCHFVQNADNKYGYNIWTWGSMETEFKNCKFTCRGKSINVYGGGDYASKDDYLAATNQKKLTIDNCEFYVENKVDGCDASAIAIKTKECPYDITIKDSTAVGFVESKTPGSQLYDVKDMHTDVAAADEKTTVTVNENSVDLTAVKEALANGSTNPSDAKPVIKIALVKNDAASTEDSHVYDIKVVSDSDINKLNSTDLTFSFATDKANEYAITAAENVVLTNDGNSHRYMFSYKNGTVRETAKEITIGQATVTGYGKYTLKVDDSASTNVVNATTLAASLVDSYVTDGSADGKLDIADSTTDENGQQQEIKIPTRKLSVKIYMNNKVADQLKAYQAMKVDIAGGEYSETIALGSDAVAQAAKVYTVEKDLPINTAYTVTVSGAGYRTARYTVNLTSDKTLNFWNNVADNAIEVELGNDAYKKDVTFLAGDIVKDGTINIYDLSAVVSYFGTINNVDAESEYAKYDLNRDGKIDSKDVAYVLVSWGK